MGWSVRPDVIRVEITRPGQYYVMVQAEGDERHAFDHPLYIFANPPETQVPAEGAPGVHFFGPGVHDIGFQYRVKAGEMVYLAGNGSLVQLGDGYDYATDGHVLAGNWVICDCAAVQNGYRALFNLSASTGTTLTRCRIENLKVWGDVLSFLAIDNWDRPTPWASKPKGKIRLRPRELHFKNVQITGTEKGAYWGPLVEDLKGSPMRSRLRTEQEGTIHISQAGPNVQSGPGGARPRSGPASSLEVDEHEEQN